MGAVPLQLLESLALPRPVALGATLQALESREPAEVAGPTGSGRSTLANQVAQAWSYASVFVDSKALLRNDESTWAVEILRTLGHRPSASAPQWKDVARRVARTRPPLWVLDDPPRDLAQAMQEQVPGAYLCLKEQGAIDLDPIDGRSAAEFLRRRTRHLNVAWEEDALAEVLRLASGQPGPLQRIGQECLHGVLRGRRGTIAVDDVLEAAVGVSHQLPDRLMRRLGRLSPARLQLLKAIARFPDATPTQWAERAGLPQKSTTVHLARLVDSDGLLSRHGRGTYDLVSPLLALYLRNVYGNAVSSHRPRQAR